MKVSIVIPNYNGRHLLERNLPSVIEAAESHDDAVEIIVADDASTDDSAVFLKSEYPGIRLLANEVNEGFAGNISKGITESSHQLLFLLNTDVVPDRNCISLLAENFQRDNIFAVSPLIYDEKGNINRYSCNRPVFRKGRLSFTKESEDFYDEIIKQGIQYPIFYATAGNSMFSKEKFLAIGGFDDIFRPFYCEDIDLGWMAWRRGWRSILDPRTSVVHFTHGSISSSYKRRYIRNINKRNNSIMIWKNLFPVSLLWKLHLRQLLITLFYRTFSFQFRYIALYGSALKRLPEILHSKQKEKKECILSNEWIFRIFELPQPYVHANFGGDAKKYGADISIDYDFNCACQQTETIFNRLPIPDGTVSLFTAYDLPKEYILKNAGKKHGDHGQAGNPFVLLMNEIWRTLRPGAVFEMTIPRYSLELETDFLRAAGVYERFGDNNTCYNSRDRACSFCGQYEVLRVDDITDKKTGKKTLHLVLKKPAG